MGIHDVLYINCTHKSGLYMVTIHDCSLCYDIIWCFGWSAVYVRAVAIAMHNQFCKTIYQLYYLGWGIYQAIIIAWSIQYMYR